MKLTKNERALLLTINGEPKFGNIDDDDLIFFIPESLICDTLGDNDRTKEIIEEKRRMLSEF